MLARCTPCFEHRVVRTGVKPQVQSQPVQEGREERQHSLQGELVRQRHRAGARTRGQSRHQCLHQRLPLAERIGREVGQLALARALVVERAGAAPVEPLTMPADDSLDGIDAALVARAAAADGGPADEGLAGLDAGLEKTPDIHRRLSAPVGFLARQQRDAQRAHRAGIGRNDDFAAGLTRHRRRKRVRGERHALAENHRADRAVAFHAVQVILDDRIVETGNDLRLLHARGHRFVDDLGHEHGAMLAERRTPAARRASAPSCATSGMPANLPPCSSMNDPVPALHASFIAQSTTRPSASRMYFASCPPISKIVSTRGS